MAKGCIHFSGSGGGTEVHNLRQKKLSYVREDLTKENESFFYQYGYSELRTIADWEKLIKQRYKLSTGKTMRKNAELTREGVCVMDENVTMSDLKKFCGEVLKKCHWLPLQIHIHEDEGHYDENKQWVKNRHAHIIFLKRDKRTGRDIHISKAQLANIQTMYCDYTNMEKGETSDAIHLNAIEFKILQKEKELLALTSKLGEVSDLARKVEQLSEENRKLYDLAVKQKEEITRLKQQIKPKQEQRKEEQQLPRLKL